MKTAVHPESKPLLNLDRSGLLQRKCDCGKSSGLNGQCSACDQKKLLQRRASAPAESSDLPPIVHEVLRSPGRPLDPETRTLMESRFSQSRQPIQPVHSSIAKSELTIGAVNDRYEQEADTVAARVVETSASPMSTPASYDFSQVQIHTNARAEAAAASIQAKAFTAGRNIVFGEGAYAPATTTGKQLLAHELTHVVQQAGGAPTPAQLVQRTFAPNLIQRRERCDNSGVCHSDPESAEDLRTLAANEGAAATPEQYLATIAFADALPTCYKFR
jgi:Domain of unknown function (DUF4157)